MTRAQIEKDRKDRNSRAVQILRLMYEAETGNKLVHGLPLTEFDKWLEKRLEKMKEK